MKESWLFRCVQTADSAVISAVKRVLMVITKSRGYVDARSNQEADEAPATDRCDHFQGHRVPHWIYK